MINKIRNKLNGRPDLKKLVSNGLDLGKNVHIGPGVSLDDAHCWLISIGDNVTIAPRVIILAHDASTKRRLGFTKIGTVEIGESSFIGAGSLILPGVKIGKNAIVGAGSVVNRDVPDDAVVSGSPAIIISNTEKYISNQEEKLKELPVYDEKWTINGGITEEMKKDMKERLKNQNGFVV